MCFVNIATTKRTYGTQNKYSILYIFYKKKIWTLNMDITVGIEITASCLEIQIVWWRLNTTTGLTPQFEVELLTSTLQTWLISPISLLGTIAPRDDGLPPEDKAEDWNVGYLEEWAALKAREAYIVDHERRMKEAKACLLSWPTFSMMSAALHDARHLRVFWIRLGLLSLY